MPQIPLQFFPLHTCNSFLWQRETWFYLSLVCLLISSIPLYATNIPRWLLPHALSDGLLTHSGHMRARSLLSTDLFLTLLRPAPHPELPSPPSSLDMDAYLPLT